MWGFEKNVNVLLAVQAGHDYYLILFDLVVVVQHRIRQIGPILPLSGRPPLVYTNPGAAVGAA